VIRVEKVNNVATQSGIASVSDLDTFVEVTFRGVSYVTKVVSDTFNPEYDEEFAFELPSLAPSALTGQDAKIRFDLWLDGGSFCEHCGMITLKKKRPKIIRRDFEFLIGLSRSMFLRCF